MSTSQSNLDTIPSRRKRVVKGRSTSDATAIADLPVLVRLPKAGAAELPSQLASEPLDEDDFRATSLDSPTPTADDSYETADRNLATTSRAAMWQRIGWRVAMVIGAIVLIAVAYRFINGPGATPPQDATETASSASPDAADDGSQWSLETEPLSQPGPGETPDPFEQLTPTVEALPRFSVGETPTSQPEATVVTPNPSNPSIDPAATPAGELDRRPWSNESPAERPVTSQGVGFRRATTAEEPAAYPTTHPGTWRDFTSPHEPMRSSQNGSNRFAPAETSQPNISWRREQPGVARLRGNIDDAPLR